MISVEDMRARVRARVWQAIAQNGTANSGLSKDQWSALVDDIVNGVLLEMDSLLGDVADGRPAAEAQQVAVVSEEEQTLWDGRPFLSLTERYIVTTERIRVIVGFLAKDREDIELLRLQDIDHKQSLGERMLNIGDITLRSADLSQPEVVLRNVHDPQQVHEIIRRAMIEARKRSNYSFQEEM